MIDQRNSTLPRLHILENSRPLTELFIILLLSREATFDWFSLSLHLLKENWNHSLSKQKSLIGTFRTSAWIMQPLIKVTNYIIFSISPYCREHDVFEAGLRSSLSSGLLFSFLKVRGATEKITAKNKMIIIMIVKDFSVSLVLNLLYIHLV